MKNQVLSIKQMQHLKKLGVDRRQASMCRITDKKGKTRLVIHSLQCYDNKKYVRVIPTFTLQDILELLPKEISRDGCTWSASLYIDYENNRIAYGNTDRYGFEVFLETKIEKNLIDAAYQTLCWLKENDIKFK